MKKSEKAIVVIFLILILALILFLVLKYNTKEITVNGKEELYDKVEQYLISQEKPKYYLENKDSEPNYNVNDFQVFTDIAKLGITENGIETNVYVWVLLESYYVQDGAVISNNGYSIPYKFIIKNDKIVDYKMPKDGSEYTNSIKEIFPSDIRDKLNNDLVDGNKLKKQVEEHYSYLDEKITQNENSKFSSENVMIEIDKNTISPISVSITIIDNNENPYSWGVEFKVQERVDEKWKDLEYVSDNLSWIDIAYKLGEDKKLTQKLDIEKYYGKLSNGTYRIVKSVYDNGYIDLYSNEFEIK